LAYPIKHFAALLFICLLVWPQSHQAQNGESRRTWTFEGNPGEIRISLVTAPREPNGTSRILEISPQNGALFTVADETSYLREVLDELSKQNGEAARIDRISIRLREPDVIRKIAQLAASSPKWRTAVKLKDEAYVGSMVTRFLNEGDAYSDWNDAFRPANVRLTVAGVEELLMQPFVKTGAKCPSPEGCKDLLVPADALVQINVDPAGRK
jgi:hypothetical protein